MYTYRIDTALELALGRLNFCPPTNILTGLVDLQLLAQLKGLHDPLDPLGLEITHTFEGRNGFDRDPVV